MSEEYTTHKFTMNALVGWSAGIVAFGTILNGDWRLYSCGIFSIIFWICTSIYYYKKTHKKPEPALITPIPYKIAETPTSKEKSNKKWVFIKNSFFIVLGITESAYFLSLITLWEMVTIPVENASIPVLTYQNGVLLVTFALGLYLALTVARTLRHPRKAFFEE